MKKLLIIRNVELKWILNCSSYTQKNSPLRFVWVVCRLLIYHLLVVIRINSVRYLSSILITQLPWYETLTMRCLAAMVRLIELHHLGRSHCIASSHRFRKTVTEFFSCLIMQECSMNVASFSVLIWKLIQHIQCSSSKLSKKF